MKLPFTLKGLLKGLGFGKGARRKDQAEDLEDADSEKPEDEPGAPAGDDREDAAEGAQDSAGGGKRRLIIVGAGASAAVLAVIGVGGWMFLGSDAGDAGKEAKKPAQEDYQLGRALDLLRGLALFSERISVKGS